MTKILAKTTMKIARYMYSWNKKVFAPLNYKIVMFTFCILSEITTIVL